MKKKFKKLFFIVDEVVDDRHKKKNLKKFFFIVGKVVNSRYEKKNLKKTFFITIDMKKKFKLFLL